MVENPTTKQKFYFINALVAGKKRSWHFGRLLQRTEEETAKKRLEVNHPRNYLSTGEKYFGDSQV